MPVEILTIAVLALTLVVAATWLHYEVLHFTAWIAPELPIRRRRRTLLLVSAATAAHVLEIGLYSIGYWLATSSLGLGTLSGAIEHDGLDFLYFSAATFTTLGVGDIVADGPLRLLVSVQALNGLVLITWSASFTWLSMQNDWKSYRVEHPRAPSA